MSVLTEAVMFIVDDVVVKEMYFAEFEAVLDDVVGVPDFAGQELQAVFLQINGALKITGAVFFIISFDKRGRIAGNWNIPLRHLLDHAGFGPDLGAGVIKVACRSACPVSWYRSQLWDPVMAGNASFQALNAAVLRNRLGIVSDVASVSTPRAAMSAFFQNQPSTEGEAVGDSGAEEGAETTAPDVAPQTSTPVFHRRYRARLKAIRSAEQLRQATEAQRHRAELAALEDEGSRRLAERNAQLEAERARAAELEGQRRQLASQLERQEQLLEERNREYEAMLGAQNNAAQAEELEKLRANYARELKLKLQQHAVDYEDRLNRRETELYQRATEIVELRAELSRLREQNRELLLSGDSKMLQDMSEKGVVFVAYHPGIEHLVIDRQEMSAYLRDPQAFAAQRCDVSLEQYQRWLQHYRLPICRSQNAAGEYCGQPVDKVMRPKLFRAGDSDRCAEHGDG